MIMVRQGPQDRPELLSRTKISTSADETQKMRDAQKHAAKPWPWRMAPHHHQGRNQAIALVDRGAGDPHGGGPGTGRKALATSTSARANHVLLRRVTGPGVCASSSSSSHQGASGRTKCIWGRVDRLGFDTSLHALGRAGKGHKRLHRMACTAAATGVGWLVGTRCTWGRGALATREAPSSNNATPQSLAPGRRIRAHPPITGQAASAVASQIESTRAQPNAGRVRRSRLHPGSRWTRHPPLSMSNRTHHPAGNAVRHGRNPPTRSCAAAERCLATAHHHLVPPPASVKPVPVPSWATYRLPAPPPHLCAPHAPRPTPTCTTVSPTYE